MRRSYESPLPLQEGWSSLQTHSRARRDTHRGLALVSGRLGNLHARTALRACSKNLQIAPNCGSWVSQVICLQIVTISGGVAGSDILTSRKVARYRGFADIPPRCEFANRTGTVTLR